jgi:hypothetical protein
MTRALRCHTDGMLLYEPVGFSCEKRSIVNIQPDVWSGARWQLREEVESLRQTLSGHAPSTSGGSRSAFYQAKGAGRNGSSNSRGAVPPPPTSALGYQDLMVRGQGLQPASRPGTGAKAGKEWDPLSVLFAVELFPSRWQLRGYSGYAAGGDLLLERFCELV